MTALEFSLESGGADLPVLPLHSRQGDIEEKHKFCFDHQQGQVTPHTPHCVCMHSLTDTDTSGGLGGSSGCS